MPQTSGMAYLSQLVILLSIFTFYTPSSLVVISYDIACAVGRAPLLPWSMPISYSIHHPYNGIYICSPRNQVGTREQQFLKRIGNIEEEIKGKKRKDTKGSSIHTSMVKKTIRTQQIGIRIGRVNYITSCSTDSET